MKKGERIQLPGMGTFNATSADETKKKPSPDEKK